MQQYDDWENLPEKELLKLRLCDIHLQISGTYVEKCIVQVLGELRKKYIKLNPNFWVSDEWFCPDGTSGVAIPFYLLHPRLQEIEKKYIGPIEGGEFSSGLRYIRHEVGHAFENTYKTRSLIERIDAFGDSRMVSYPNAYKPKKYSKNFVKHLEDGYAQSHPDEDFAETFAVWLDPKSKWRQNYKGWSALHKLNAMGVIVKRVQDLNPRIKNNRRVHHITKLKVTYRQYLISKRRRLKIKGSDNLDLELLSVFDPQVVRLKAPSADNFLIRNRQVLRNEVAKMLGTHNYELDPTIDRIIERSRRMKLTLRYNPSKTKRQILDLITRESLENLRSGRDKIIL